jgi:MFS family permease
MDNLATILFIISIVGLILSTPLLLYYGRSFAWETIFMICIAFGIIACVILIYLRTPDLEHIQPIVQPITYEFIPNNIENITDKNQAINDELYKDINEEI